MRRAVVAGVIALALGLGMSLAMTSAGARPAASGATRPAAWSKSAIARSLEAQLATLQRAVHKRPRTITAPAASLNGGTCFVGLGSCSIKPCVEFVGSQAESVAVSRSATIPPAATHSECVSRPGLRAATESVATAVYRPATSAPATASRR